MVPARGVTVTVAIGGVALHPWRLGPDTTPLPFWPLRDPTERERIFSAIQAMGIRNARVDLRKQNPDIRVSLIMPGIVRTEVAKNAAHSDGSGVMPWSRGPNAPQPLVQTAEEVAAMIAPCR